MRKYLQPFYNEYEGRIEFVTGFEDGAGNVTKLNIEITAEGALERLAAYDEAEAAGEGVPLTEMGWNG